MTTATKTSHFDHSKCKHAKSGAEGKKARAACRKENALKAAKAKPARKPRVKAATAPTA